MARTHRRTSKYYRKHGPYYNEAKADTGYRRKPFARDPNLHGRDGAYGAEIGGAQKDSPNCRNSWDEAFGPNRKRHAKSLTGRYRRIVGNEQIQEALGEIGQEPLD
jgi:hypothetical protein